MIPNPYNDDAVCSDAEWGRMQLTGIVALFETDRKSRMRKRHAFVLYLASNLDWGARQRERNGNRGTPLAVAMMTDGAWEYLLQFKRAMSLQYSGSGSQTPEGLAEDMRDFDFDEATIARFVVAAERASS